MNNFRKLEFWLTAVVLVLFVAGITNAAPFAGKYQKIADGLTTQMKKDLADQSLTVEIIRAENMQLSKDRENFFGDAYLISEKNDRKTHIYFEANVNTETNKISLVDYHFVENDKDISQDFLEKIVIKKLGNDNHTKEVVFAMDELYRVDEKSGIEKFRGVGLARVGTLEWKKIKFEITLNNDSETVLYQIDQQ